MAYVISNPTSHSIDWQYLLLDGLLSESQSGIFDTLTSPAILEIGCGSGAASVFLATQFKTSEENKNGGTKQPAEPIVYATDINPFALQTTKATAKANSSARSPIILEAIQCDLLSAISSRLEASIDILIFNPPYVPTPDSEVAGNGIEASWAGGKKGRRVIDRAIPQIAKVLSRPNGVAYMITVDDNEPEQLAKVFASMGLEMTPLVRRRAHNEFLSVQKITWGLSR